MRDKRLIIVIGCAVVFGLVAALLVGRYLSNVEGRSNNIVVAKVNIPLSTKITAEQLTVQQLPRGATPDGTFTDPAKLVGRVTITNIGAREPLTALKLAPDGSDAGLTAMISEGFRAITVKVDEVVSVAGFVQPGAWVDVVAVINPPDRASDRGPTSKIVLQHIKVLATDQNIEKEKKDNLVVSLKAVTLQVTPEQAEKLALSQAEGKLQLVMRNSVDKEDVRTPGSNKNSLLTGERVTPEPEPAKEQPKAAAAKLLASKPPRKTAPRLRAIPPFNLTTLQSGSLSADKMDKTDKAEKPPKPAPASNSVEVFDGKKRQKVELP